MMNKNESLGMMAWNICPIILMFSLALLPNMTYATTSATRTSSFTYDATTGLLTKEIIEPGTSNACLVTVYAYDGFGNKTSATKRPCNGGTGEAAAPTSATAITSRVTSTAYDSAGRFVVTATNPLSQSETRVNDTNTGMLTSLTGPNGLATTWTYDNLGRKTQETRADGSYTQWAYLFCSGVNGGTATCPSGGKYLIQTTIKNSSGTVIAPVTKVYFDVLLREIRTETQGFDGTAIYKDTVYNSQGLKYQVSDPYYSGGTPSWTTYLYDALGRPTQVTAANGGVSTTTYNGLTTSLTNPLGQTETRIKNSQGQVIEVDR